VVKAGLKEGENVVLNALALIDETKDEVLKPVENTRTRSPARPETDHVN